MVRFILSNANSTLANGIYTFSLDQRLPNASFLQLKKANFQLTTTDVAPLCVYIRSSALHDLCSEKHTVELKGQNLKRPTLQDDTDSDRSIEEFLLNTRTSEPSTFTSRTRRAPTCLELDRMPVMYPPPPKLQLEQISGCLSISSTPPRSPRPLPAPSQR